MTEPQTTFWGWLCNKLKESQLKQAKKLRIQSADLIRRAEQLENFHAPRK